MISEYINNIDKNNIVVCDPIKNSIIQYSSFYKLIYTNEIITMNGIYILFDLNNVKICIDKITFDISSNYDIIDKLSQLEEYLLNLLWYNNKYKYRKISEFMNNGNIKYTFIDSNINTLEYSNKKTLTTAKIILKISGIWESGDNIGLTFKIILVNDTIDLAIC
tara:strand:- start:2259 stop:2750 length:492 start_codon:yes stop_codon:yes gene_type:complete